jgi:hypothetical protein
VSRFPDIAIRFSYDEAQLVVEALSRYQPEAPADRIKVKAMRDLMEGELAGAPKR